MTSRDDTIMSHSLGPLGYGYSVRHLRHFLKTAAVTYHVYEIEIRHLKQLVRGLVDITSVKTKQNKTEI